MLAVAMACVKEVGPQELDSPLLRNLDDDSGTDVSSPADKLRQAGWHAARAEGMGMHPGAYLAAIDANLNIVSGRGV